MNTLSLAQSGNAASAAVAFTVKPGHKDSWAVYQSIGAHPPTHFALAHTEQDARTIAASLGQQPAVEPDAPTLADVQPVVMAAETVLREWLASHGAPASIRDIADNLMPLHQFETHLRPAGPCLPSVQRNAAAMLIETRNAIIEYLAGADL